MLTPTQLATLKSELVNDPAAIGYGDSSAEAIHVLMEGWTTTRPCLIPLDSLQAYLMQTIVAPAPLPIWWTLEDAKASNPIARMAYDLFNGRIANIDPSLPFVAASLQSLADAGYLDQAALDAIGAMGVETVNRGVFLFGSMPTVLEIELARL